MALQGLSRWLQSAPQSAALGGVLVATGLAAFGPTETVFIHSVTIGWYVILTAVFFVCTETQDGQRN